MRSILDEIRHVRHEMSAEIAHDPRRILEFFSALQNKYRDRIVNFGATNTEDRTKHCIEVADQPLPDGGTTAATR